MGTIDTMFAGRSRSWSRRGIDLLFYLLGRYDRAVERHRSRQALQDLDDRLLADIGISRGDAREEVRRSFWD